MKKILKPLFLLALILCLIPNIASATAETPIRIWMNGSYIQTDVDPFIESGRTLVPVRVITENLGYQVDWDGENQLVSIFSMDDIGFVTKFLALGIDDPKAHILNPDYMNKLWNSAEEIDPEEYKNNVTIKILDVAPKLVNARTFVPIRFIAEEFNVAVDWDADNFTVLIGDTSSYVPVVLNKPTPIAPLVGASAGVISSGGGSGIGYGTVSPSEAAYIGNLNSKKFHYSGCREERKMSEHNRVGFNTRDEAVGQGFIPCKVCNP